MDTSTAVRQRILELCAQREITVNRLATLSGVTQSTVNNIISGRNRSATVYTARGAYTGKEEQPADTPTVKNHFRFHILIIGLSGIVTLSAL